MIGDNLKKMDGKFQILFQNETQLFFPFVRPCGVFGLIFLLYLVLTIQYNIRRGNRLYFLLKIEKYRHSRIVVDSIQLYTLQENKGKKHGPTLSNDVHAATFTYYLT